MATPMCTASVRRAGQVSTVYVRSGPGTHTAPIGTTRPGVGGLRVLDVQPDEQKRSSGGKVYQWFRVAFPDGIEGWIRDDLLDIQGNCTVFGYGQLDEPTPAFDIVRADPPLSEAEQTRIRRAAFNITAAFEGSGYAAYQNYDAGLISYGRFQFTLASGSLFAVLDAYLRAAVSDTAQKLGREYYYRVKAREYALRYDGALRDLLIAAAEEPEMQAAQDRVATDLYWTKAQVVSILPRNMRTALGQALIFDMSIHHGPYHNMFAKTDRALGVLSRWKAGSSGISEQQYITRLAYVRREWLYSAANYQGLPGLKVRADFWIEMVRSGDWALQGDSRGEVTVKRGVRVQVRAP